MALQTQSAEELIVILAKSRSADTSIFMKYNFHLLQSASSRVFIVIGPTAGQSALCLHSGIKAATNQLVPDHLLIGLSESERRFIKAWNQRKKPKERHGEGRNWNDPQH